MKLVKMFVFEIKYIGGVGFICFYWCMNIRKILLDLQGKHDDNNKNMLISNIYTYTNKQI